MQENKNQAFRSNCNNNNTSGCGTVCIDTKRVLDCCRDRDCFEDARVYLTQSGEGILVNSSNVRTRAANLLCAYVGVDEVPFNAGFYHVSVRYYIEVEFEACVAVGRSQNFKGLAALEKDVVLYGGEGKAMSFSSSPLNSYCNVCNYDNATTNDPVAVVDTVEPIVLGTKVADCTCPCSCACSECSDIPEGIRTAFCEELVTNSNCPKIYVSFGIFSVIRMLRPAQILVQGTDYSVPDKECTQATNNDNPCSLFRTMSFPVSQFRGTERTNDCPTQRNDTGNGCSCGK